MSFSSITGSFGIGRQTATPAFGSVAAPSLYIPATSLNLNMNQNSQTLPAEVGGDYFLRGSYKASVMGGGDASYVVRPNGFGHMLMMLCGQDTTTAPATGVTQHTFSPFLVGSGTNLPWHTLYKNVAGLYTEQYLNSRMRSLKVDISKSTIMTASSSFIATTPSVVTTASLGTQTFDSSPQFQTCQGVVSLQQEGSGVNISANSIKVERFSLNYDSNLTTDEFSVGNYYLDDITLLQRTVTVDMDFIIRDSALYQAVYLNGGTVPGAWSPTIYRGTLAVTMNSSIDIPTTTTPYSCVFNFPGLDFLMMPISLQGANEIKATLSTQVTLGTAGDRFNVVLTNGVASY